MSKIWLVSDLHIGHKNIIKYCSRPFGNVWYMNEELVRRWNDVVAPDDLVYNLGDVAFANTFKAIEVLNRLNGRVRLIIGNHDKRHLKVPEFRNHFEWIKDRYELEYKGYTYLLTHEPIKQYKPKDIYHFNLHGHTHRKSNINRVQFDCGIDNAVCNYAPISLDEIAGILKPSCVKRLKHFLFG